MMNILAGSLFLLEMPLAAYLVGGCLLVLQAIVIATHFCALSWMYEGVSRMLGTWNRPLEPQVAQQFLQQGATVIDVRSPQEYAGQHLACAINMPLENLSDCLHQLPAGTLLLHCKSGMRSNMALQLLRKNGFDASLQSGWLRSSQKHRRSCLTGPVPRELHSRRASGALLTVDHSRCSPCLELPRRLVP